MKLLSELSVGRSAKVVGVLGDGEITCRLLEMGLTPGAVVKLLGTAPWGDPMELEIRNYRLSLRRREAGLVEIDMA